MPDNQLLLDKEHIQILQDRFCHVADLSIICLDRDRSPLTRVSLCEGEPDSIAELLQSDYLQTLLTNVGEGSVEDLSVETLESGDGDLVRLAVLSMKNEGRLIAYWIVTSRRNMSLPDFMERMDLVQEGTEAFLSALFQGEGARVEEFRIRDAEAERDQLVRTLEATKSILQLLDSSAKVEVVMHQWTQVVSTYLGLDYAQIYRLHESDTMDVMVETSATGLVSPFEKKTQLPVRPLLTTQIPLVLSSDLLQTPEYQAVWDLGLRAVMIFPLLNAPGGDGNLVVSLDYVSEPRTWTGQEVKFAADAARVLQSILIGRIHRSSIAESIRALEDILNNVGCSVYLVNRNTGRPLFANKMLENTFEQEWHNGKLRELVSKGDFSNPDSGSFEIFYAEKERWYDLIYKQLEWVDGSAAIMYSLYDITDRRLYQRKIEQQAFTDFLTGLYNRMCCERDLAKLIDEAKRDGTRGALIYLDLDNFKHINDGLGHQYGDILLKSISGALAEIKGLEEHCYRMGGDEFVILVSPDAYRDLSRIMEQISEVFRRPWYLKDSDYYCTASIGSVTYPDLGDTVAELIKKADIAMYEAKKSGKNRQANYSEGQDTEFGRQLNMEKNMRDAENTGYDEFEVYYQPIIDVENGGAECAGAEALVRWNSSRLGFIPPSDFIPLAEYLGLINPIGNHVLEKACKACKAWNEKSAHSMKVNVNLSVVQLLQNDIVECVERALKESGLAAANLTLEVTESLAINDMARMKEILSKIKALGVSIALDDFGTGYSSLNHIREIPFDIIKVDQSFVKDLAEDAYSQSFVRMVAELAETIGVKICVEGIETPAQYQALKNMKIKYIQGFYFDRPLSVEDFEEKYLGART